MMETKLHRNQPSPRHVLYFALTFMVSLQLAACVVGYETFHTEDWDSMQPMPNLANVKISYIIDMPRSIRPKRILQSRFHILDIQPISQASIHNEMDRFVIRAEETDQKMSLLRGIWASMSIFSFSVIPAVIDRDTSVTCSITAPGGEEKTFHYSYTERLYNWLPFIFFSPGIYGGINAPTQAQVFDSYQKDRTKIRDGIIVRFMTEASPFILSHTARSAQ